MSEKVLNEPITRTFGWLHMNGTRTKVPEEGVSLDLSLEKNETRQVILKEDTPLECITGTLEEGALLQLIQISSGSNQNIKDIRITCEKNARFEWYRLVFNAALTYDNCSVTLKGANSEFSAAIGYRLKDQQRLDINCEAIHLGKKTRSDIYTSGILSDEAFKLLRGTIDLRRGCAGAKGKEFEEVLLLSEQVHNQSIPIILCSEEDVEGDHGATIGQIPEEVLFYMASRGIPEEAAYQMAAKARIDAVIRRIPDENLRNELLNEETT